MDEKCALSTVTNHTIIVLCVNARPTSVRDRWTIGMFDVRFNWIRYRSWLGITRFPHIGKEKFTNTNNLLLIHFSSLLPLFLFGKHRKSIGYQSQTQSNRVVETKFSTSLHLNLVYFFSMYVSVWASGFFLCFFIFSLGILRNFSFIFCFPSWSFILSLLASTQNSISSQCTFKHFSELKIFFVCARKSVCVYLCAGNGKWSVLNP